MEALKWGEHSRSVRIHGRICAGMFVARDELRGLVAPAALVPCGRRVVVVGISGEGDAYGLGDAGVLVILHAEAGAEDEASTFAYLEPAVAGKGRRSNMHGQSERHEVGNSPRP